MELEVAEMWKMEPWKKILEMVREGQAEGRRGLMEKPSMRGWKPRKP